MSWLMVTSVAVIPIVGCSDSHSPSAAPVSAEVAEAWFDRTMDALAPCQIGSTAVDAALGDMPVEKASTSIPVVLAAGQAVEDCTALVDDPTIAQTWQEINAAFPAAATILEQWLTTTIATDRAALEAAATNLDDRRMVGLLYDDARRADEIAAAFEAEIQSIASDLGIDPPTGRLLLRWNAPNH